MAQVIADRRDVDFVLHEQLEVEKLSKHERFAEFNKKTVDLILSEARNLAVKELLPALKAGDTEGCRLDNGQVHVPEAFHRLYQLLCEGEWLAKCDDPEWGGQGMPATIALAADSWLHGGNYPFMLHALLGHGAGKLVETFGNEEQKKLYLKNMYSGRWGGTMLLTEPEAGSDVGALTTAAVKNPDGTYAITGNKIFISSGDNDLVENIIHPVLARIEGAPSGTAGISLFLVPKIWVNPDGSLGEPNDVICTGIEEKMGIHGSPTCSLALGSKGKCRGTLLGQENKGMRAMFVMMNEARLNVGVQGLACASASFMNALNYARDRVQGKHILSDGKASPSVPIIQHPDVRRMLLTMKAYTEGMRSILFYVGMCEDLKLTSETQADHDRYQGLIDVLIPVAKGYITDRAFEMCSLGVQVYGGYGFTKEYPQEQLLRDCKITQIYEGTNGIQAMDLVGRKLGIYGGRAFQELLVEMNNTIETALGLETLKPLALKLDQAVDKLTSVSQHLITILGSEKKLTGFASAYPFLDSTGDTVMAWMLIWRAVIAARKLAEGAKKKDAAFYEGQLLSARFFINTVLPLTLARLEVILADETAVVDISDDAFGGK